MSKTARRFLSFFWRSGTKGVQGINDAAAQEAVEKAIENKKDSFPELSKATKASVESRPHSTPKADGRTDPLHANFRITSDDNRPITSAHYYPTPLGGKNVWFSKPKYNDGQQANEHFVKDEQTDDEGDRK
ncbi:uncharacterized protein BO87DRAFT_415363 [Aspergillus neoniger CBS 115656]|uniref:Uncharacterized protein n=1 Tax=Aspergillus neoniger (strain CBS 115656) TaxID=1448310 RepID=A0A318YKU0_ASPNB|nr:hypothetical protein BO87DRAFT_415363 [Aspergillus neoniger CBS 115656]PYH35151.1 hypothetical protein BO87DRAFT_415363 [Aspergillus neoniger CBS 115656]